MEAQPEEINQRLARMERHLRNMRMAVIVVVAFFVYDALMPSELRPGRAKTHSILKTEELVLTNRSGDIFARLVVDEDKGVFNLHNMDGAQTRLTPTGTILSDDDDGTTVQRLRITPQGISLYDEKGRLLNKINN